MIGMCWGGRKRDHGKSFQASSPNSTGPAFLVFSARESAAQVVSLAKPVTPKIYRTPTFFMVLLLPHRQSVTDLEVLAGSHKFGMMNLQLGTSQPQNTLGMILTRISTGQELIHIQFQHFPMSDCYCGEKRKITG